MTSSGSLDANVLLRVLLDDVPKQHAAALRLVTGEGQFTVSDTALIEVIFVLGRAYGLTREQQQEAIMGVLYQPQIAGQTERFAAAFNLYAEHPKLSFEDCYLVTTAEQTGNGPLWTFNRKLANQSDARLLSL